ncbi:beta-N-acetylglucosaminidase domain-containing protein [Fodinicola feengrottensis]|uniref:beta-N-acetylglucosaminidase domain-containing protein n=1 Tax=Fodinicola feengrottensis TaxID=435914 RepID=UPI0031D9B4D2
MTTALMVALGVLAAPTASHADVAIPAVSPTPQSITAFSTGFALPSSATLVVGTTTDASAISAVTTTLHTAGVASVTTGSAAGSGLAVYVGGPAESGATASVLSDLGVAGPAGLPSGGYVLAAGERSGTPVVALSGVDPTGTFYAAQTLRQLIVPGSPARLPGVQVRDWPGFSMRGGEESFYGQPWAQADLLHQMDFLGQHKMNSFLYTVSGDDHTAGANWRVPYPAAALSALAEAVARANANHVDFLYRIDPEAPEAPNSGICHSSQSDLDALIARYQQLWDIGIHTISIGWDDTSGHFLCAADTSAFGSDASPTAAAQAYDTAYVQNHFVATHSGGKLIAVPQEYAGTGSSTYRTRFAALTPPAVTFFWTGPQVVSPTISGTDFSQAQSAFGGRPLLIFDNYPVNDYESNQQHLGPLVGRDPALAQSAVGLMANEMQEEEPSLISLFTIGDFDWNPGAYNAQNSWSRSLAELGGPAADALRKYAESSVNSPLTTEVAPVVQPLISAFVTAFRSHTDLTASSTALLAELEKIHAAPATLRSTLNNPSFLADSEPYFRTLEAETAAAESAVAAVEAVNAGDEAAASQARAQMSAALVGLTGKNIGAGVYDQLVAFARGSRPSTALKADNGDQSIFARGADGQLYTSWQTSLGSGWQPPAAIAGITMQGTPDVIVTRGGAMAAVVRASDNTLRVSLQSGPGGGWGSWTNLGAPAGAATGSPRVVLSDNGLLSVFVRGADGKLYTSWQNGENSTSWHAYALVANGVAMVGDPDAIMAANGTLSAYVRDGNGHLWTSWQPAVGSAWHDWTDLGAGAGGDPRVLIGPNNAMSLYFRGGNGQLFTTWQSGFGGSWSKPFTQIGSAAMVGTPDVAVSPNGALSAYVHGADDNLWTTWQSAPGSGWTASAAVGLSRLAGNPRMVEWVNGALSAFGVNRDGQFVTSWQSWPGSGWSGAVALGGPVTP